MAEEDLFQLNWEAIDKEAMYDGLYGVTTDMDDSISKIIAINKRRWQIEKCFKIIKTKFKARPIYR